MGVEQAAPARDKLLDSGPDEDIRIYAHTRCGRRKRRARFTRIHGRTRRGTIHEAGDGVRACARCSSLRACGGCVGVTGWPPV